VATLVTGQPLPAVTLTVMDNGAPKPVASEDLMGTGLIVLFAVPGAFTPTCSVEHLPGFVEHAAALRQKGVDRVICTAVNDIFVMDAWARATGVGDEVIMAADGNGELARALDLTMDASAFGMGERSQRYAIILRDGLIKSILVEEPGEFRVSSAESVLDHL
jgi:peroxiredoxin